MTADFEDRLHFWTDWPVDNHTLLVAIPAAIGTTSEESSHLFDPASEFCVISRLGSFEGTIDRIQLTFRGFSGETLGIDATWIIIEDWPGPSVIGWRGCLERMRFAVDPMDNWFYFAEA